jgi:hypothetical protein
VKWLSRIAAITAIGLAVSACGSSTPLADAALSPDGLLVDGGVTPDGMVDGMSDSRGPVTIRVVDKNTAALADIHVVFIDTDGTTTTVLTDAAGQAIGNVRAGASATAIRQRDGGDAYSLTTILALAHDDVVTLITAAGEVSSLQDPFTQRVVPLPSADIATASKSGQAATYTTVRPHGLVTGDRVIVDDVLLAGYNGSWTVESVPSVTVFTANIGSGGLQASTGGTATKALPFTFNIPSYSGASSYEVHTPCGPVDVGLTSSPTLLLRVGCARDPMDVTVYAKSSSVRVAAVHASGVALVAGGSTTLAGAWQALSAFSATYTNPTTRVTSIAASRYPSYVRGAAPATASGTASDASATLGMNVARPASAWMRTILRCPSGSSPDCISSSSGVAQQIITQQIDGTSASYALDVAATLLPWVSAVYVPQSTTIQITVTGTGAIDLFEANLRYIRGQTIYTWRVFGPVAGSVTFPTLPSHIPGDPTVRPQDTQSAYQVYLCETNALSGYRAAIQNVYETLGTCESSASTTVRPTSGTFNRLSQWN